MNGKLIYPKLSYIITGILFEVHNGVGRYGKEKQYANFLENKLKQNDIKYEREYMVGGTGNIIDLIIEDKVILELKAKRCIEKDDYYQIQRYLQALDKKLGLLINFRNRYLKPLRIIKIDTDVKSKFI